MDGGEEHIGVAVEDRLRTIPMMIVDIEYGDLAGSAFAQNFGRDGRIVQKAIAAIGIRHRVMAGGRQSANAWDRPPETRDAAVWAVAALAEAAAQVPGPIGVPASKE